MKKKIILLSGVAAGHSGAARLITQWKEQAHARSNRREINIEFIFGKEGTGNPLRWISNRQYLKAIQSPFRRMAGALRIGQALQSSETLNPDNAVLICHPQGIGLHRTLKFIRRRNAPVWMYLLDNSFFCLKSYNHVEQECHACMRCLPEMHDNPARLKCRPYAGTIKQYGRYFAEIQAMAESGKLRFMSQCQSQTDLARTQFGAKARIAMVGIWGDWDVEPVPFNEGGAVRGYDVVFHGNCRYAKGFYWAMEVARACPEKEFLFPFHVTETGLKQCRIPLNCKFIPMTWEKGLRDHLISARVALVPSLWSAPVEGALVKSLALGCAVAVVAQESGFASELPSGSIIRLPQNFKDAAQALRGLTDQEIEERKQAAKIWAGEFRKKNADSFDRIIALCTEDHLV